MTEPKSDLNLWNDFRNGNEGALTEIYNRYADSLFRYGRKFSTKDEIIKDTIQDLFFTLIRRRSKLGNTDQIYFYLLKSFRRELVRNLKKDNPDGKRLFNKDEPEMNLVYSLEDELIRKENLNRREQLVLQSLKQLSARQREIIYYRFTCNFEYEQICDLMSLKYDSARKMVFRAIKTLREKLEGTNVVLYLALVE